MAVDLMTRYLALLILAWYSLSSLTWVQAKNSHHTAHQEWCTASLSYQEFMSRKDMIHMKIDIDPLEVCLIPMGDVVDYLVKVNASIAMLEITCSRPSRIGFNYSETEHQGLLNVIDEVTITICSLILDSVSFLDAVPKVGLYGLYLSDLPSETLPLLQFIRRRLVEGNILLEKGKGNLRKRPEDRDPIESKAVIQYAGLGTGYVQEPQSMIVLLYQDYSWIEELICSILGIMFQRTIQVLIYDEEFIIDDCPISNLDSLILTYSGLIFRLEVLQLVNDSIRSLQPRSFQNLGRIKFMRIDLSFNKLSDFPYQVFDIFQIPIDEVLINHNQLHNITQLGHLRALALHLNNNHITDIETEAFSKVQFLKKLDLGHNNLNILRPELFRYLTSLIHLDLSYNKLTRFSPRNYLPFGRMTTLRLTGNSLTETPSDDHSLVVNAKDISRKLYIRNIHLDRNNLSDIPMWVFPVHFVYVNMSHNIITRLDLDSISNCSSESNRLQLPSNEQTIDYQHNKITSFDLPALCQSLGDGCDRLSNMLRNINFNLQHNDIACDSTMLGTRNFLLEALSDKFYALSKLEAFFQNWTCTLPSGIGHIVSLPDRFFGDNIVRNCPTACNCFRFVTNNFVTVNCTGAGLAFLPSYIPNGTGNLLLQDNSITQITVAGLKNMRNLRMLDVSNNEIYSFKVDETSIAYLKNLSTLKLNNNRMDKVPPLFNRLSGVNISISGNPFICNCKERWLLKWVLDSRNQITDYRSVYCYFGSRKFKPIYLMTESEFGCIDWPTVAAIVLGCILVISIVLGIFFHKFKSEVKLLLYMRLKQRILPRQDNVNINDKKYDAFVSYAKEDRDYIFQELMPRLEADERGFSFCLADRHFLPGSNILDNIAHALKESRRMIMYLTPSFVASEWCMYEFRLAHHMVLLNHSNFLIIILEEGLNMELLDEELKLYIRTKTYIKCGNRWFWEGIWKSLPMKSLQQLGEVGPEEGQHDERAEELPIPLL